MADNEFLLHIIGEEVSPQSVDVEDLNKLIRGFRGALAATAGDDSEKIFLALTRVSSTEENHDTLTLAGSQESIDSARRVVAALSSNKPQSLPERAQKHLRIVWETVWKTGWESCQFEGNGTHIGHADIHRDKELYPRPYALRGITVLYGECVRVGGVKRRSARLHLLDGTTVTIRLKTQSLAKQLGERLYQVVGLKGEALWSGAKRTLDAFVAESLTDYTDRDSKDRKRSIVDAFTALSEAAGNRWDNVSPDAFIEEQRRD